MFEDSKFTTPFENIVPFSDEDVEALRPSVEEEQHYPIQVTPDMEILDGHKRHQILGDACKFEIVKGLKTDAEKEAKVIDLALGRKQLSAKVISRLRKRQKELAVEWRMKNRTQQWIARRLGVSQQTVQEWLATTNTGSGNSSKDLRKSDYDREVVEQDISSGELTQNKIAAKHGISQQHVAKIKKAMQEAEVAASNEPLDAAEEPDLDDECGDQADGEDEAPEPSAAKPKANPQKVSERAYAIWYAMKHAQPKLSREEACARYGVSIGIWKHLVSILKDDDREMLDAIDEGMPASTAQRCRHGTPEERKEAILGWRGRQRRRNVKTGYGKVEAEALLHEIEAQLKFGWIHWEDKNMQWQASTKKRLLDILDQVRSQSQKFDKFWRKKLS